MTITGDVLLFFLGLLALILMGMSGRNILLACSSSMLWFALAMWMLFSDTPPLNIQDSWVQIIAWVFVILTFIPWLLRMDVEIKNEARGQGGQSWRTWGAPPSTTTSRYEAYKEQLLARTRGKRRR